MNRLYWVVWQPLRVLSTAVWGLRGYGAERVPAAGGLILASNHQSFLDPILIGLAVHRQLHFLARRSLFRFGPFRAVLREFNAHPIDRDRGDLGAIRTTLRCLGDGAVVLMFPEGTRTKTGRLGTVKQGVTRIAQRAGVPIVPVLVEGTRLAWPPTNLLPIPGPVNIILGSPVVPRAGFPGPADFMDMWKTLSREPHRRIPGGFLDG